MKPIFKKSTYVEKSASLSVTLENPPEKWEEEILRLAYKMHDWIADFDLAVDFLKKVPDMRYGIGSIQIFHKKPLVQVKKTNTTDDNDDGTEILAHIPVIVKDGVLYPLDLFIIDGKAFPLEKELFYRKLQTRPDEGTTSAQSDPTIIGYFWPPGRAALGGPGAEYGLNVLSKFSSMEDISDSAGMAAFFAKEASVLKKKNEETPILSGILEGKLSLSREKVAELAFFLDSDADLAPLKYVVEKVAEAFPGRIPDGGVFQRIMSPTGRAIVRHSFPGSFSLNNVLDSDPEDLGLTPRRPIVSIIPPTAAPISSSARSGEDEGVKFEITKPGIFTATLVDGIERIPGYLISHVFSVNGNMVPGTVFYDATQSHWYYDKDLKILDPKRVPLSFLKDEGLDQITPDNAGVFICPLNETMAFSLPPMRLKRTGKDSFTGTLIPECTDVVQLDVDVYITSSVIKPKAYYKEWYAKILIPDNYIWKSIGVVRKVPSMPITKMAQVPDVVMRRLSSDSYLFEGEKVKGVLDGPVDRDSAEFVLANLGVPAEKCAELVTHNTVELTDCYELRPKKEAAPIQCLDEELFKAASSIGDPNTVDAVLGLNIADHETPDDYLILSSELENTQQKLARLLLLSRLGYYIIPEGSVKVVMTRLTPIINSLKVLALSSTTES